MTHRRCLRTVDVGDIQEDSPLPIKVAYVRLLLARKLSASQLLRFQTIDIFEFSGLIADN